MKIYTKTGDKGETSLRKGQRVKKSDPRIWLNGELDELTTVLGLARSFSKNIRTIEQVEEVQHDLFLIGAGETAGLDQRTKVLEKTIDEIGKDLPALKNFIFLGGSKSAGFLYLARSVCRRAERRAVETMGNPPSSQRDVGTSARQRSEILVYLNRLSDLLFVLARRENQINKVKEKILKK